MALKNSCEEMSRLMGLMREDLPNIENNKAAAARVRKNTLAFEKNSKTFRKESVAFHKK